MAALVRAAAESNQPVWLTRRGRPVAVILSTDVYARLLPNQPERDFGTAYAAWRQRWPVSELDLDPETIWGDV